MKLSYSSVETIERKEGINHGKNNFESSGNECRESLLARENFYGSQYSEEEYKARMNRPDLSGREQLEELLIWKRLTDLFYSFAGS